MRSDPIRSDPIRSDLTQPPPLSHLIVLVRGLQHLPLDCASSTWSTILCGAIVLSVGRRFTWDRTAKGRIFRPTTAARAYNTYRAALCAQLRSDCSSLTLVHVDNPFSGPDILDSPAHRELCEGWNQVSYTHSIDPPIPLGTEIY